MKHSGKATALYSILFIYTIAVCIPFFILNPGNIENPVLFVLIADIIATCIVFSFSMATKNSSVYDPYWSVIPPLIVGYLMWIFPEGNTIRQIIILIIVLFWSIRLTANWARGWTGFKHQDWRYTKLEKDTGKFYWLVSFLGIHMFPTILVFLGCLPLFYILPSTNPFTTLELVAIVVAVGAVFIEWIADEQLKKFKAKAQENNYMDKGLWSISRHPNYLGEILFWLGIFLFVPCTFLSKETNYTAIGFFAMILLFRFISIPMMEKRNLSRKKEYANYILKVPRLFPVKFFRDK